jgi:hypothetical protein
MRLQYAGVAQDVEYRVGDAFVLTQVEFRIVGDLVADENDVPQHRKQVLMDALDHFAVDEGDRRCALDVQLDAAFALHDADVKRLIPFQQFLPIVDRAAAVEHGQCAIAEDVIEAAWLVSSSLFTSAFDRTSSCPSGEIRVSTTSCSMMRKSLFMSYSCF